MAADYGYRVFVVKAFHTKVQGNTPLKVHWGSEAATSIVGLLESAHVLGTKYFEPRPPLDPALPVKSTASLTIDEPTTVKDGMVHVGVSAGEIGSHRKATRPGKKAKSLRKSSPEADHFCMFLFPLAPDDRFLLVTQTVKRRDPVGRLLSRLQEVSKEQRDSNREAERVARAEMRKAKLKLPEKQVHTRLVFDRRQAADDLYLDDILAAAKSATAVFTGYAPSSRGVPERVERTLRVNILLQEDRKEATGVSKGWMKTLRKKGTVDSSDAVTQLAGALSDDIISEDDVAGYNRAALSIKALGGLSTTIASDNLREVFTYPVSEGAPGVEFFYGHVADRLEKIAAQESLDVPDLDAKEVAECLDGST